MRLLKGAAAKVSTLAGAIGLAVIVSGAANAAPINGALDGAARLGLVEPVQYVYRGHRHCWYNSGWQGPGWYRCGYNRRHGYGYGGPRGWNNWQYSGWGPVVVAPPVMVVPSNRYYWNGRYYSNRARRSGRWYYY